MTEFIQGHNEANDWICQGDVDVYLSVQYLCVLHIQNHTKD